jgi:hypothetical protein
MLSFTLKYVAVTAVLGALLYGSRPRASATRRVYLIAERNLHNNEVIVWPHADRQKYSQDLCTDFDKAGVAFDNLVKDVPAFSYKLWSVPALVIGPGRGYAYSYEVAGYYNMPVGGTLHRTAKRALREEHMMQNANGVRVVDPTKARSIAVTIEINN